FNNKLFAKILLTYFQKNNIISVFSRLNPYIKNQLEILKYFGDIVNQGKVVNINLNLDITVQKQNYQNRLKTQINQSRRNCIIKKASTTEDLKDFIDIYYENMSRVGAKNCYFFSENYFKKILASNHFNAEILMAQDKKSSVTIAGCLFVTTNNIVQYHLSGTKFEFLHLSPTKILIDEMRIIASKRGMRYFNLGGGVGGKYNSSLFHFKSLFSKDFKDFNLWKLIVNHKAYDELVEKRINTNTLFFPKYRF
ncbi:MAG TPA: peptidoglycan bridge formation glycyltransferase FemA/FemB family protein, partial [Bacteroidales bacterium]|nr:peptidoglycan bridge formation glycyltransferase FemA/FemB family protein [Bacteroidales bacterium]